MNDHVTTGRYLGTAMAAGMGLEMMSNLRWQAAVFGSTGFLQNAGGQAPMVGLVIVGGLLAALLSLWVAARLAGRYARDFPALAWFALAMSAVALAATLCELSTVFAMRGLSAQYLQAGADAAGRYEPAAVMLRQLRNGLHLGTKLLEGVDVLSFFALLWCARVVPRWLAGAGAVASLLQMAALAPSLFGGAVIYALLGPLALVYLGTIGWLLAKGLPPPAAVA